MPEITASRPNDEPIPRSMRAVVCHGPRDYRLEELPVPEVGPGEVLIRVGASGVCASDAKCHWGAPLFWGDAARPPYVRTPCVPGHEFVGTVVSLDSQAGEKYGLKVGDTAISEQIVPCWNCRYCQRGQYWMCQRHDIYGFRTVVNGAWAEYMKFPAGALNHRVPDDMPIAHAALIEPLACSIHAVQRGEIELGDTVVIAGAGTLGLGMVGAARLKSPGCLVVLDTHPDRLEIAKKMGADVTLNPAATDVVDEVLKLTDGYGCDVYIEASGYPAAVSQGLRMIRKLGTFVEFSVMPAEVSVDWTIIGDTKELNIHGSHLGPYCYPVAIDFIRRGVIDVGPLITHQLPLESFQDGLEKVHDGIGSIKVLLTP
ncbi:MAG: alcohol dehydrogenase catalytic domain-containing protein [Chloroflexi bacterium]|nr:alcohol dehydrogenase catalytic domain-containing protein [Chloroflexota bacterium]